MRKLINLFLVIAAVSFGMISCAENKSNLSQTGLFDQSGNLITDTIIETNIVWVTNNIQVWIGKGGVHSVTTNLDGSVKVEYTTNVRSPNLPEKPSDLYRVHVPFAGSGDGYYTVNYKDMNRKVTRRWNQSSIFADDVIIHTGEWTVGAIYRNNFDIHTAREKFAEDKGDATDGVYDFIAARRFLYTYHDGVAVWEGSLFERQYYSKGFIEVLVLNPHTRVWDKDGENNDSTLGVDSYYAYYGFGSGTAEEHGMPGFQEWNMPYMISPRIYLAQRPEYTVPLLSHTTTFTDDSRHWCFLAIPGHKY